MALRARKFFAGLSRNGPLYSHWVNMHKMNERSNIRVPEISYACRLLQLRKSSHLLAGKLILMITNTDCCCHILIKQLLTDMRNINVSHCLILFEYTINQSRLLNFTRPRAVFSKHKSKYLSDF